MDHSLNVNDVGLDYEKFKSDTFLTAHESNKSDKMNRLQVLRLGDQI